MDSLQGSQGYQWVIGLSQRACALGAQALASQVSEEGGHRHKRPHVSPAVLQQRVSAIIGRQLDERELPRLFPSLYPPDLGLDGAPPHWSRVEFRVGLQSGHYCKACHCCWQAPKPVIFQVVLHVCGQSMPGFCSRRSTSLPWAGTVSAPARLGLGVGRPYLQAFHCCRQALKPVMFQVV